MIPKKIHYCWFGGNPLPERDKKCIESWEKYCPDYEIIRWDETNYDISKNKYMSEAHKEKKWGFVPDYARLDIIYNEGGIYLDTDVELIKNIDFLLEYNGFASYEDEEHIALGLGFGSERNNAIIKTMKEEYENVNFLNPDGTLNLLPSPAYTSNALKKMGIALDGKKKDINNFILLPKEYFCPKEYHSGKINITDNTCGIHWFNASWQSPHQKRMLKLRRILGDNLYFSLVKLKNKILH